MPFHRDHSIRIERERERAKMDCQNFTYTRAFDMGLTSAEGTKLECFKRSAKHILKSNMKL